MLEDGDVEGHRPGVVLDLALLAVQAGLGPGFHVPSKARHTRWTSGREAIRPGCEILCNNNKMAVNVGKTKFVIFQTRGKHFDQSIQLTYDDNEPNMYNPDLIHPIERFHLNHPIITNRAYKILGVYLDKNLTFDCHTNFILTKLNRSLYCINKVKNILPPSAFKSLYFSLIHSHLTQCSNIASCA